MQQWNFFNLLPSEMLGTDCSLHTVDTLLIHITGNIYAPNKTVTYILNIPSSLVAPGFLFPPASKFLCNLHVHV